MASGVHHNRTTTLISTDKKAVYGDVFTHHGQRDNPYQILLANVDFGEGRVSRPLPGIFHLPGDGLRPGKAAEAGDFEVQPHDLAEGVAGTSERETKKGV